MNHRGQHYYDVTADTLSDLFQPDNVRNGESLSKLLSLGGIPGIEKALVTNTKVKPKIFRPEYQEVKRNSQKE